MENFNTWIEQLIIESDIDLQESFLVSGMLCDDHELNYKTVFDHIKTGPFFYKKKFKSFVDENTPDLNSLKAHLRHLGKDTVF